MKKKITESQLRSIIAESVKKVLKEAYNPQDDIDAKEFMSWAMNSRSDVMQNIYGYYQASREGNESNANWYMDKILFAYADEKGCEESQLNTNAIEKAINEWGYYNYQEDDSLNEGAICDMDLKLQEKIYQTFCSLESDIQTVIMNTDDSGNKAFGGYESKLSSIVHSLSHIDSNLAKQANSTFKKLQEVLSELQDIRISLKTWGSNDKYWGHNFKTTNGTVGLR